MGKIFHDKQCRIFCAVTLAIFCLILLLNCITPMVADDYSYAFIRGTSTRLESISDIFVSQWTHYFAWGGRSVVHFIAQFFLLVGKPVFNIFNSIVFVIYINLISFFSFGRKSTKGIIYSFLAVWLFLPVSGSVLFWLVGSCNYLWGTTFVFLLIYRYYNSILKKEETQKNSFFFAVLWFLFGIIAGWCNENTSGMGIFVCCLLALYKYKTSKKIPLWQITGILGAVLGFSLMIAAPGNYIRATAFNTSSYLLKRLLDGFVRANEKAFAANGIDGVLFFLFLFTYLFVVILPNVDKERKIIGGIWFLGALACNYAMTLSPSYPARASCGVYSMYFVSILYAGRTLIEHFSMSEMVNIARVLLCVGCLYFSVSYAIAVCDIGMTYIKNNQRVEIVMEEKSKGNYDITVPRLYPMTKYNVFSSLADWPRYNVTRYFGINSITVEQ